MLDRFLFEEPLHAGRLVQRYKRFLADIELADGTEVTAHCANSGSMLGMKAPGSPVMLRHVPDPKRKLKWTWEMIQVGDTWVGCNTHRPNQVAEWAIMSGQVPSIPVPEALRREVKYGGNSRIDMLLETAGKLSYVEVKNTTLADGPIARFPDAVTARGAKHMDELAAMVAEGHDAVVLFFVNRDDCHSFEVAQDIDPAYAAAFARAVEAGVRPIALGMRLDPTGWTVRGEIPIKGL